MASVNLQLGNEPASTFKALVDGLRSARILSDFAPGEIGRLPNRFGVYIALIIRLSLDLGHFLQFDPQAFGFGEFSDSRFGAYWNDSIGMPHSSASRMAKPRDGFTRPFFKSDRCPALI